MDLAKIRKKSLLDLREFGDTRFVATSPSSGQVQSADDTIPAAPVFIESNPVQPESFTLPTEPDPVAPLSVRFQMSEPVSASCTPVEAILAARTAAGCDNETTIEDVSAPGAIAETSMEFLSFRVSDEIYGIDIMEIKEIIKPREVTEVPRAPVFMLGVLSLRGTIIPVIDMRLRLGLAPQGIGGKERIIVIKNNDSFSGLLVDEVVQVVQVLQHTVEAPPLVLDGIERDFVNGLGKSEGRLIILLNLQKITDMDLY